MPIIKGKGTFMSMVAGAGRLVDFFTGVTSGTNSDTWVQSLGYSPKWKSENQQSFGSADPVEVDDTYDGITANFDILETQSAQVMACLTDQDPAAVVSADPSAFGKSYIFANFKDLKSTAANPWIRSVLLKGLKVTGADTQSAVDGVQTKKFDFEGTGMIELFGCMIKAKQFTATGTGSDLVCNIVDTMVAWKTGYYALAVLVDGEPLARTTTTTAGCYVDTGTTSITIKNGLANGKKVTILYGNIPT